MRGEGNNKALCGKISGQSTRICVHFYGRFLTHPRAPIIAVAQPVTAGLRSYTEVFVAKMIGKLLVKFFSVKGLPTYRGGATSNLARQLRDTIAFFGFCDVADKPRGSDKQPECEPNACTPCIYHRVNTGVHFRKQSVHHLILPIPGQGIDYIVQRQGKILEDGCKSLVHDHHCIQDEYILSYASARCLFISAGSSVRILYSLMPSHASCSKTRSSLIDGCILIATGIASDKPTIGQTDQRLTSARNQKRILISSDD